MTLEAVKAWAVKAAPDMVREVCGLSGVGLVTFGISQIYGPAGYIFAGLCLIAIAAGLTKKVTRT